MPVQVKAIVYLYQARQYNVCTSKGNSLSVPGKALLCLYKVRKCSIYSVCKGLGNIMSVPGEAL